MKGAYGRVFLHLIASGHHVRCVTIQEQCQLKPCESSSRSAAAVATAAAAAAAAGAVDAAVAAVAPSPVLATVDTIYHLLCSQNSSCW